MIMQQGSFQSGNIHEFTILVCVLFCSLLFSCQHESEGHTDVIGTDIEVVDIDSFIAASLALLKNDSVSTTYCVDSIPDFICSYVSQYLYYTW